MQFNLQPDRGDPMERCRLCACHCSPSNKVDIFSEEGRTRALEEKMRACLPLESQVMLVADRLPRSVCCQCVALLERFHTFRQDCISASALLRKCLEQYNARPPVQQGGALQQHLEGIQHQMRRTSKGRSDSMPTLEPQIPARRSTEGPLVPPPVIELDDAPLPPAVPDRTTAARTLLARRYNEGRNVIELSDDEPETPIGVGGTSLLEESLSRGDRARDRSGSVEELAVVPARPPRKVPHSVARGPVANGGDEGSGGSRRKNAKPRKIARTDVNGAEPRGEEEEEAVVDPRPFSCVLCEKNFTTKSSLSRHLNACHGVDMADLDASCPRPGSRAPKRPPPVPADDGFLCCELCLRTFADKQSLWLHFRYSHKREAPFACGLCLKLSADNSELSIHWRAHYNNNNRRRESPEYFSLERRYSCEVCGRQDNSRKKLLNHLRIHVLDPGVEPDSLIIVNAEFHGEGGGGGGSEGEGGGDYFPCGLCYKAFESEATLAKHRKNSHKTARPECEVCYSVFPSESSLSEHRESCRAGGGGEEDVLYCKYCSKQFATMRSLEAHQRQCKNASAPANHDVLSHHCEVCKKAFVSEDCLVKHKKGAHGRRDSPYDSFYFCEVCASSHPTKIDRWRHVNASHADEESIRCPQTACGKVFSSETLAVDHRAHHEAQGSFPNTCEVCGRLSDSRVEFWKHVQGVHAEMLPYVCGVCLKMFNGQPDLVRHVAGAHRLQRENFHCRVCARQYSNQAKCARHEAIHGGAADGGIHLATPPPANGRPAKKRKKKPPAAAAKPSVILVTPKPAPAAPKPPPAEKAALSCDVCPRLGDFATEPLLAQHRRDAHKLHPCDLCPKFYGRNSHLWKHVNRKHKGHALVTCPVCEKVSATNAQLAFHLKKNHKMESPPVVAPAEPPAEPAPNNHILSIPSFHVGQNSPQRYKTYDCPACYKTFVKRYMLRKHERRCRRKAAVAAVGGPEGVRYSCAPCGLEFDAKQRMIEHNRAQHRSSPCETCGANCATRAELFAHVRSLHPELRCSTCSRHVRSLVDMAAHAGHHARTDHPPYCELCGEVPPGPARLWTHLNAHHRDDVPFFCGVCFARLPDTEALAAHVRATHPHALAERNTCGICAKAYCSAYRVADHVSKYHDGYVACRECLLVLRSPAALRAHSVEVHRGGGGEGREDETREGREDEAPPPAKRSKRSYDCDRCALTFSQPSYLEGHRRRQHPAIKTEIPDEEEEEEEEEEQPRRRRPARSRKTLDESIQRLTTSRKGEESEMPSLTNERDTASAMSGDSEMPVLELHVDQAGPAGETGGGAEAVDLVEKPSEAIDVVEKPSEAMDVVEKPSEAMDVVEKSCNEPDDIVEKPANVPEAMNVVGEPWNEDKAVNLVEKSYNEPDVTMLKPGNETEALKLVEEPCNETNPIKLIKKPSGEHASNLAGEAVNELESMDVVGKPSNEMAAVKLVEEPCIDDEAIKLVGKPCNEPEATKLEGEPGNETDPMKLVSKPMDEDSGQACIEPERMEPEPRTEPCELEGGEQPCAESEATEPAEKSRTEPEGTEPVDKSSCSGKPSPGRHRGTARSEPTPVGDSEGGETEGSDVEGGGTGSDSVVGKDCLNSLEDALDILEAQNT